MDDVSGGGGCWVDQQLNTWVAAQDCLPHIQYSLRRTVDTPSSFDVVKLGVTRLVICC